MYHSYRSTHISLKGLLLSLILCCSFGIAQTPTLVLLDDLNVPGSFKTDVWGYVDIASEKYYAIVGDQSGSGITIVDVTDPTNLIQVANVPTVPGFDLKVHQNYVYTVNGGNNGNGGIVDISDPANPQVVGGFPSAHNIWIDNGYLYAEFDGLKIYSLSDPVNPALLWSSGGFDGHDAITHGNILYDFHGYSVTNIYDITTPGTPQLLGVIDDPTIAYNHSGDVTEDGRYLFICDELSNAPSPDITVWDILDPSNPVRIDEYADNDAIVHNIYVRGSYAFVSYYTAGLRVFDVSDPSNIQMIDEYDTNAGTGEVFAGAFGCYIEDPRGLIYVSDWDNGLFVFEFETPLVGIEPGDIAGTIEDFQLLQNYPNPFNPATTLRYNLNRAAEVTLTIYNSLGQPVKNLVRGEQSSGDYSINWNGTDSNGNPVSAGIYVARLSTNGSVQSIKMALIE